MMENNNRIALIVAHRVCLGVEHDPENGKIHGCCIVCGYEWPCPVGKSEMTENEILAYDR